MRWGELSLMKTPLDRVDVKVTFKVVERNPETIGPLTREAASRLDLKHGIWRVRIKDPPEGGVYTQNCYSSVYWLG